MPSQKDVDQFVAAANSYVERALKVTLDGSEESLAFVDHYVTGARASNLKDELLALVAPALGSYLGEVAIKKFGGRWVLESEDPAAWRVELEPVPLRFWPVGMAAEALRGDDVEGYDASFASSPALMGDLLEQLSRVPPVEQEYYYSLTGRLETLTHVVEILVELQKQADEETQKPQNDEEA
jgi:hypothetical protein